MRQRLEKGDRVRVRLDTETTVTGTVIKHNADADTWFVFCDAFVENENGSPVRLVEVDRKEIVLDDAADR